ncbi:hypothetical protein [Orbus mooreae]
MFQTYIITSDTFFEALVLGKAFIPDDMLNSLSSLVREHMHIPYM